MGVVVLLIVFFIGWATDHWRTGLAAMVPIAAMLTLLCLVTTNNPALTTIEAHLRFSPASVALNFLVKLAALSLAYSAGFAARNVLVRLRRLRPRR